MQFEALRNRLRSELIAANPLLAADRDWKRAHYLLAEKIVNDKLKTSPLMTDDLRRNLGATISNMTLRRFLNRAYDGDTTSDLRFLKSIDKLCIFLGYKDFTDFTIHLEQKKPLSEKTKMAQEIPNDEEIDFIQFIKGFLHNDFAAYNHSMDEVIKLMEPYVSTESPYMARILEVRGLFIKRNMELVQEHNRSNYELISARVVSADDHNCVVETQEYWNLVYKSRNTGERFVYDKRNRQVYFLKKESKGWRIWDNHNPDTGKFLKESTYNPLV